MIKKVYYNLNQVVKIEVYPERENEHYRYKKESRFRAAGVYDNTGRLWNSDYSVMAGSMLKDGVLFIKPECRLIFPIIKKDLLGSSNQYRSFYFDTYEQALEKAEEIRRIVGNNNNWI